MTYEDMKRLGLGKYCAVPGEIYKRESDGKYFTVSEDGRKIEVTPEPGMVITGIIPDCEFNRRSETERDVFWVKPSIVDTQKETPKKETPKRYGYRRSESTITGGVLDRIIPGFASKRLTLDYEYNPFVTKTFAIIGKVYMRESDGLLFKISEDGEKVEVPLIPGIVISGVMPDSEFNRQFNFDGDVFWVRKLYRGDIDKLPDSHNIEFINDNNEVSFKIGKKLTAKYGNKDVKPSDLFNKSYKPSPEDYKFTPYKKSDTLENLKEGERLISEKILPIDRVKVGMTLFNNEDVVFVVIDTNYIELPTDINDIKGDSYYYRTLTIVTEEEFLNNKDNTVSRNDLKTVRIINDEEYHKCFRYCGRIYKVTNPKAYRFEYSCTDPTIFTREQVFMALRFNKVDLMFTHESFDKEEYIFLDKYTSTLFHQHNGITESCDIDDFYNDKYDTGWRCYTLSKDYTP